MQLLKPSPGVCVDRQTILILKIEAAKKKHIFAKHFGDECNAIQDYLQNNFFILIPKSLQDPYDKLYKQLEQVNQELWNLEDEQRIALREYEKDPQVPDSFLISTGERSFKITKLNNQRSCLVQDINSLFGIVPMTEKIHEGQAR